MPAAGPGVHMAGDLLRWWAMPSAEDIRQRIEAAIPGARAEVEDYTGGGDHFRATVTAASFEGRSRIEQHRLVYEVFDREIGGAIHALALKTQTPVKTETN
ncbi:MAG: BolA family transcriptional regulator [Solirubrobacterales bacterium]|jgi:stress-induced morphogen|nr:BolA family transcriptional regulator [Solirubrobacterales bacterium]